MRSSMCWPAWSCWPASARSFGPSAGAEAAPVPPSGPQGPRRGPPQPTGHPGNAVVPAGGPRPLPAHLPGPAEYPRRRAGVAGPPPEAPPQGPPAGGRPAAPSWTGRRRSCPAVPKSWGSWPAVWTSSTSAAEPPPSPQPEPQSSAEPCAWPPVRRRGPHGTDSPSAPRDLPVESPGALFLPFRCPVGQKNSCKRKNAPNFPENTLSFSSCL